MKLVRKFTRIGLRILFSILPVLLLSGCSRNAPTGNGEIEPLANASITLFAMDTVITLEAYGGQAAQAVREGEELIGRLENLWSVTDENSEIYHVNHSGGQEVPVSPETEQLVKIALDIAEATEGAMEPTLYPVIRAWGFTTGEYRVPTEEELSELLPKVDYQQVRLNHSNLYLPEGANLDLGAVAKGYAGDLVAETLRGHGVTSAIINLGGNVSLLGVPPRGGLWRVGIRSPYGDGNIGVLEAADTNIITSGVYERYFTGDDGTVYGHILNPADGIPVDNDLLSVTIIGTEGGVCDSLSTAMFVKGLTGAVEYWQSHDGFEMILVTKNKEIYVTEHLQNRFELTEDNRSIPVHIINHQGKEKYK